ncbi:iron-containing alcohol dehydrogenase [Halobacillus massiliensis]|uniref:iron-containing alcohol dehydrogenase n=1 Tax=Halobacillus massiliensis TaxID=1926286 RepID=UPI0009E286DA|nr:iron-containing alcohol dehydrogenase [Halobacillus massiliensis]
MYKFYCRTYQFTLKMVSQLSPLRKPALLEGHNSLRELPKVIKEKGIENILIVTDQGIKNLGLMDELIKELENQSIDCAIYDQTVANPTIENIEEAMMVYNAHYCQGIIAFGGGSSIDCAKAAGARIARPEKSIPQMKGELKIRKDIPFLAAVPTTSGTGSEATLAAVITNSETHEKYAINDPVLVPDYAVLDPLLIIKLPPSFTASTGMDALTHAVEAYIGRSNTQETEDFSREAVKLIFENLLKAYSNGENVAARENMHKASHLAGMAFTRAYVGYVHAIAHTLGGFYSIPHGLANAIILPYVLRYYGEAVYNPLADLAEAAGLSEPEETVDQKAVKFIDAIEKMNEDMNIPKKIPEIEERDIPLMASRAFHEANPLYPVPKILTKEDLRMLYQMIKQ